MSDDDAGQCGDTAGGGAHPEVDLAHAIRSTREEAGLTQGQLANRVGFSREYVSRAERPSKSLASRELVTAIDAALGAGGVLVALRTRLYAQRLAHLSLVVTTRIFLQHDLAARRGVGSALTRLPPRTKLGGYATRQARR